MPYGIPQAIDNWPVPPHPASAATRCAMPRPASAATQCGHLIQPAPPRVVPCLGQQDLLRDVPHLQGSHAELWRRRERGAGKGVAWVGAALAQVIVQPHLSLIHI
eukprot:364985-Chlamydomonas_euryale.AAC.9